MTFQISEPCFLILCLHGLQICLERGLGIYYYIFFTRQPDYQVWPQISCVTFNRFLFNKVTVRQHAGDLDDPLELDLSPTTAYRGDAQCPDQIFCL